MLHVTNGDSVGALLRGSGLPGEVLPWRDVLHEGPVPAEMEPDELRRIRARFIADRGWGQYEAVLADLEERDRRLETALDDDVVLWFEHDLYDQLQLLQILDRLHGRPEALERVSMVCIGAHPSVERFVGLGQLQPEHFPELFEARTQLTAGQLELARAAWAAFRSPDPTALEALIPADTTALSFLRAALLRHLEQFPSTRDGLSRTEHQILEASLSGVRRPVHLFHATQDMEAAPFLGDAPFWARLAELCSGPRPLLRFADGGPLPSAWGAEERELVPTPAAEAVRRGAADWVVLRGGINRWCGGVHLQGERPAWRWNRATGGLTRC